MDLDKTIDCYLETERIVERPAREVALASAATLASIPKESDYKILVHATGGARIQGVSLYDWAKGIHRKGAANILKVLTRLIRKENFKTIADIGCGTGLEAVFIGQYVLREGIVFGVDESDSMLDACRERQKRYPESKSRFLSTINNRLPLLGETVDLSNACCVIGQNEWEPEHFISELARITRPRGQILITIEGIEGIEGSIESLERNTRYIQAVMEAYSIEPLKTNKFEFRTLDGTNVADIHILGKKS